MVNELIEILERKRVHGEKYVQLHPDNLRFLNTEPVSAEAPKSPPTTEVDPPLAIDKESAKVHEAESEKKSPDTTSDNESFLKELDVSLSELKQIAATCERCSFCKNRTHSIFGSGNPDADLMFIGDGPGVEDDLSGSPFVDGDEAGKLLNDIIKAMKFTREQVYATNVIKCFSDYKRLLDEQETELCTPYLKREIELVRPKAIVLLGPVPLFYLTGQKSITKCRGKWITYKGIDCMPTFHPSYLLRMPKAKRDVWNDMQKVMEKLA